MKTLIATTAFALTLAAPAAAEIDMSVEQYFALSNDSAAERIVDETSEGNPLRAEARIANSASSAAETDILAPRARANDVNDNAVEEYFAMESDSPAERYKFNY